MKYYVVCNDSPLGTLPVVKGPGLRAHQLHTQITAAGHDAEFLMFAERYSRHSSEEDLFCSHKSLRLIPVGSFRDFENRIEPSTFVFTQANFVEQMKISSKRHRIIFDFIARKDIELAESGNPDKVGKYLEDERVYVENSDVVLTTSPKLIEYITEMYNAKPKYNPFSFQSKDFAKIDRPTIVFGGRIQKWTNYANTFDCIADYLTENPEQQGIFLYTGEVDNISDVHAKSVGRLLVLPNVTVLGFLPTQQVEELVGKADLFVDCSEHNAERSFATSIRTVHAIACGTAAIHNVDTGLDRVFTEFPGELRRDLDVGTLSLALEQVRKGGYARNLSIARNAMDQLLTRNELAW